MARIRTIKPEFFRHESLYEAERDTGLPLRVAFAGLWTTADREGRFKWKPKQLKLDCLPFDEIDFSDVLEELANIKCIVKYQLNDELFGFIPSWKDHQVINQRESQSSLPAPENSEHVHARAEQCSNSHAPNGVNIPIPLRRTVFDRDGGQCLRCGSPDDLTIDHIFPQSIGGTHAIANLRTLCRPCNSGRPVAGKALIDDLAKDGLTLDDMSRMCMHVHAHGEGKGREGKGKEEEGKGKEHAAAFALPDWIDADHWNLWLKTRKGKKMIPEQMQAQVGKLAKWRDGGLDYKKALFDAATAGWQGLFEPKPSGAGNRKTENFAEKDYGTGVTPL